METNTVTIYYDPKSIKNHNPNHGSLECGSRTKIDIFKYFDKGYKITFPHQKSVYLKFLEKIHGNNPVIKYLLSVSFKQNILQKVLRIKPKSMLSRNCHGCTMVTTNDVCPVCNTIGSNDNFFKYIHLIDKNISDSDTTYITHTSYRAIMNAISLVCQMMEDVKSRITKHGFALIRPPGHHACNDMSGGFCLVNNIAIAAEYALHLGFSKIFIFDFDAHHGNGTQQIFYDRNNVFYCSMHTMDAYPKSGRPDDFGIGNGYGFNLNIIVPKNVDDQTYLDIYKSDVVPEIIKFNPDIILISAGFDGLASDPMAIMNLSPKCYGEIIKILVAHRMPICMILEGGYNKLELLKCFDICLEELSKN
jgi:acetoin utilization deacetylase AcuC-like enzyme